ncbi:hypothetical protein PR001_g16065 [Phytophthora rubi]|uniref:Centrosomal protein of 162 kDa n=1 Tax=Phytophthora rubi TaxID=129364 RepID=A0A6A3KU18_9STRA|nr:hypothetical protein PR001_g16065 [Phytophthora rubi]
MADSDSDGEFERFLQEDEDSLSPEPTRRRSKPGGAYTTSSASAVTAAAAALLASSKLIKNHKSKSKSSDKKKISKKSSRTQLSDSEEAPPSYFDDYSTGRGGGLENSDADPYAFDLSSPAVTPSAKKADYDEDESDEEYAERKKKKKEEFKTLAKKALAKSTPISMEDRIAEILKRTGSTRFQAEEKSDEDLSDNETPTSDAKETSSPERDEATTGDQGHADDSEANSEAEHSSLSDSLGIGSADFEVQLPPRPSLDRKRLSLSSLDSEKFAVNREALDNELATPSRYEQQQMTFLKSEQDEESATEKDEYGDDDFELDHSAVNDAGPPPYSSFQDNVNVDVGKTAEESFVSQFDKMKELLLADPVSSPVNEAYESRDEVHSTGQPGEMHLSGSSTNAGAPQPILDASDTFGYGDEEFEETEGARQDEQSSAKLATPNVAQSATRVEYRAGYEDDTFEADTGFADEAADTHLSKPSEAATENQEPAAQAVGDPIVDKDSRLNALLAAKYGDFYTLDDEGDDKDNAHQSIESQAPCSLSTNVPTTAPTPIPAVLTPIVGSAESPPSSPPPPPPPDEDEDDDQELNRFTLDASADDTQTKADVTETQRLVLTVQTRENRSISSTPADRFREIENHVASLRFVQPVGTPTIAAANSPATEAVHPVSARVLATHQDVASRVAPSFVQPMSISFDTGLLDEDEDTQHEIDEFVRSSQMMRQENQAAAQRASIARENGLMLRLQQAQRQILQLKEHIQVTARNSPPVVERDMHTTSESIDADNDNGERYTKELSAAGDATSGISQAAYCKLQKEIKTQDTLIAAFQKENERLMQQLKQVRQDVQYDVHEANEELRRQIKKLQDQSGEASTIGAGGDLTSKAQYRVAVEARLEAEAHALALQEELAAVRLSYQQKVNEVTLELDRVKKAKVELECRYEGVDLTQVAQEAQHARGLQTDLDLAKKEHAHALNALQKKLDWYVENQRLLDDQDEELRKLRRQVAAQSSDLSAGTPTKEERPNAKAGGPSPARSHRRSPNDIRRIQELEGRLVKLEEAMRRRHPDSLANLILASRRADEESKTRALERDYEDKLAALSCELEQAHDASETRLASFRQQQEKLLLQYRRKIKEQEKQLKQLSKAPLSHRSTPKDSAGPSGAELAKVRRFYSDKIKELERKWEAKYRSLRKQQYSGLSSNQQVQEGLTYADSSLVIANLQRQIRDQELELKQEKARVEQLEAESQLVDSHPEDAPATNDVQSKSMQPDQQRELEKQVADLKSQLEDSESARARLAQTLTTVQTLGLARALNSETTSTATETEPTREIDPVISKQTEAELSQLRHDVTLAREALNTERAALTEKIARLEKQITEHSEKNALLEAQLAGNHREMQSLQTLALEAQRHNRSLEAQARRVPELEEEVLSLRRELELPRTPSMVQYRSLELKVATLEQKHKLREAELKVVLDRALTSTHLEQLSRERAHRAAIAAKNAEIASFKHQLEEILDELAQLQPPSSRAKTPPPT